MYHLVYSFDQINYFFDMAIIYIHASTLLNCVENFYESIWIIRLFVLKWFYTIIQNRLYMFKCKQYARNENFLQAIRTFFIFV